MPGADSLLPSPALLISVRTAVEARAALDAGCQVLDIKAPEYGSLGRADSQTWQEVLAEVGPAAHIVVSAALGEAEECLSQSLPLLPPRFNFVKLGTADLCGPGRPPWQEVLDRSVQRWNERRESGTRWIAVAYADWERCHAPSPKAILDWASTHGAAGLLCDTAIKDGQGLLSWMSRSELAELVSTCRQHALLVALAGSLTKADVPLICGLNPDLIAVRGAACDAGDRTGHVSATAVRQLLAAVQNAPASKA